MKNQLTIPITYRNNHWRKDDDEAEITHASSDMSLFFCDEGLLGCIHVEERLALIRSITGVYLRRLTGILTTLEYAPFHSADHRQETKGNKTV